MADPVAAAREARTHLRQGLAALQGPGVPAELLEVAEPIAQAMGELFEIEHTAGAALQRSAPAALHAVRQALAMLQARPGAASAVDFATEAVAGSLGVLHALSRAARDSNRSGPAARGEPAPRPANQLQAEPAETAATAMRLEVALGAHSASNFYQGLSEKDVIDSGGLFVATYQVPSLGQHLSLKVSLPGGYEFEAMGVVRWTRDAQDAEGGAPPGFGLRFTRISAEGRQLARRYVRNREPLFHEDP